MVSAERERFELSEGFLPQRFSIFAAVKKEERKSA
jgi:hypothetical protein